MLEPLKATLKQKWLNYYKTNHSWLKKLVDDGNLGERTADDGIRPKSWLILGVVSSLEPTLTDVLPMLCQLNTDDDELITALGLDFDPDKELEKIANQPNNSDDPDTEYLNKIREENK